MNAAPDAIDPTDLVGLTRRQEKIDRLLMAEGAGHLVHDLPTRADGRAVGIASRPWRLDPLPYVITAEEFLWIEEAVTRRMTMFETLLDDLYSKRSLVSDGLVDPALLWGSDRYRLAAVGRSERRPQRRWLTTYAVDVVRSADGVWFAIADHTDAPSGLGYALLDRSVLTRVDGDAHALPRSVEPSLDLVRRALADSTSVEGPRVVVFTSGVDHPAYVEQSYLATLLGFNLVEGPDLVVRDRHLWLQTLGGLEQIDVLHRRLTDRSLDPMEQNTTGAAGIPGVLLADEAGTVTMANAHGAGVVEDRRLRPLWDAAGEKLLGEQQWLTLAHSPSGGIDTVLGRPAERVNTFLDNIVHELPLVLRFHAVAGDAGISVIPVANGRVLFPSDDPAVPTPCLAKDVWVLGDAPARPSPPAKVAVQVDLLTSVPTRAADSLYWMCRAAERSEAVARACRVVGAAAPDPSLGGQPTVAMRLVAALTGPIESTTALDSDADTVRSARDAIIVSAAQSLQFHIGSMLAESATVREFLSATTGRVLGEIADTRRRLDMSVLDVEALDSLLLQLSAFAGLWSESVVRGPAWYFGDFARRYERSVVSITGAATAIRCAADPNRDDVDRRRGLESVLAANDSLVAYRRRHRSDVELDAVLRLLLHDERNPRSAAASLAGLERNAQAIGWNKGADSIALLRTSLADLADVTPYEPRHLDDVAQRLHTVAAELASTRLVAPPHPTLIRSGAIDPGAVA